MMKILHSKLTKTRGLSVLALLIFASASVYALQSYKVDNTRSKVEFSGKHAGMSFKGEFKKWQATVVLPPQDNPSITASFDLRSAKTGDFTYDSTLPEGDWFDVENHPNGGFVSDLVEVIDGGYKVSGMLTLKGISKPQSFVLKQSGDTLTAKFPIKRLDFGIGLDSDPEAEWVSADIEMSLVLLVN
jgi:polyisoprenoid-binding protein YceI